MTVVQEATRCISQLKDAQSRSGLSLDSKDFASILDHQDVLAPIRDEFHIPGVADGDVYFCAHALGPMPKATPMLLEEEIESWKETGAPGHSQLRNPNGKPWTAGHASGGVDERYTDVMADLVGAKKAEVAWMGGLSINLHALLNTFYRPTQTRYKILFEANAFPSDRYVLYSQVQLANLDPSTTLIPMKPRDGEETLRTSDILSVIERTGGEIALIMFGSLHWGTGQLLDMKTITKAGKSAGCVVGWDCAHAAGNVVMRLHDWNVDFAAWCTYKYLFSGPGATAGIFVHEKHFDRIRPSGWWGHEIESRFAHAPLFKPRQGAAGFAVSNPSVFGTVPLHAAMQVYQRVASTLKIPQSEIISTVRGKSVLLTGYLEYLVHQASRNPGNRLEVEILSPPEPEARGACLCFVVRYREAVSVSDISTYSPALKAFAKVLADEGVILDKRAPDLVRLSPSAMYNTFEEVWRVGEVVKAALL